MNRNDEHDDLWELLGNARQETPSPFFSRNVLREVRQLRQAGPSFAGWLRRQWHWALIGACAVLIVVLNSPGFDSRLGRREQPVEPADQIERLVQQLSQSPDLFVIANLDELEADAESSIWLDEDGF